MASISARFGRTVRALRAKAGYSQESFADAIGVHRTTMGTLEGGDGNPGLDTIVKIARGLDLSLSELFVAMEKDTGQGRG
jgi:DNA-binding XRE family transcriptional regulator